MTKTSTFQFKPFSQKQRKILNWWCDESPVSHYEGIIADGAIRSGKTLSMSLSFVFWAMEMFNDQSFAMCGKTIGSFRRNVLFGLKRMLRSRGYTIEDKRTDNLLIIYKGDIINYFYIFGGKDERSQDLIQGITLAGLFCDEVALMPESFVNQATARCSVEGSKYWFNCNPEGPNHWFKKNWIDNRIDKNILYLHFTMEDNLSLSESIKNRYRSMYFGVFYERYIRGLWKAAEGAIYQQFINNPEMFIIDLTDDLKSKIMLISIGIDYGASKSKTTIKAVGITHGFNTVYALAEKDISGIHNPEQIYKAFHEFYNQIIDKFGKAQYCYADYGALGQIITAGLYNYCRKEGLPIKIDDCLKGSIIDRIELTCKLMAQGRLKILKDCPNLIRAFQDAVWNEKVENERLDDGTSDIDSLDAFEYAIYTFSHKLIQRS